ncbi:hypothetical protein AKJ16_DCAP23256 [Drosera capensis]
MLFVLIFCMLCCYILREQEILRLYLPNFQDECRFMLAYVFCLFRCMVEKVSKSTDRYGLLVLLNRWL